MFGVSRAGQAEASEAGTVRDGGAVVAVGSGARRRRSSSNLDSRPLMRAATTSGSDEGGNDEDSGTEDSKGRRSFSLDIVVGNEIVDEGVVGGGSLRRDRRVSIKYV